MWDFLRHPFFLLLVGSALTGLIVPAITRWWQIHQKELEIKIDLVSEISESVMTLVMATQFVHVAGRRYRDQHDELMDFQKYLNKAYRKWAVRSSVIGTKLQAYFPATSIPQEWAEFSLVLQDFYAQEGMSKKEIQTFAIKISNQLSQLLGGEPVGHDWGELRDAIVKKKSEIIAGILASRGLNIGIRPLVSLPNRQAGADIDKRSNPRN